MERVHFGYPVHHLPPESRVPQPFPLSSARRRILAAACASVALAPLGCGSPIELADDRFALGTSEVALFGGLVQSVTVTPAEPTIGEEIGIRSVVRNAGDASARFLSNVCRLDLESTLELTTAPDWAECKGLPHQVDLAPGDSIVVSTRQRVHGIAGEQEIRVLHVLEPLSWVTVRVRLLPLS